MGLADQHPKGVMNPTGNGLGHNEESGRAVTAVCLEVADPEAVQAWLEAGWMPNLARVRREGRWSRVTSISDISSGAIWPTFFTGVTPAEHGQFFTHMQLEPGTYEIVKKYADAVPFPPFWSELQRHGLSCAVIDVPQTFPATEFRGIHVVGWGGEYPAWPPSSSPPELMAEIRRRFGRHPLAHQYRVSIRPETDREHESLFRELLEGARGKAGLSRWIFEKGPYDFFLTVFSETHWAMHLLWHLLDPGHPARPEDRLCRHADVFRQLAGIIDEAVGALHEARPDADLLVFSLSGMGPNYSGWHILPEVLDRLGMGPPAADSGPIGRILSPTRRWGAWKTRAIERMVSPRLLQVGKSVVPHRVWDRWTRHLLHANSGWSRSRAFCLPNDYSGAIRINLEGREPEGQVKVTAYEATCDEIEGALTELKDIATGEPIVREVIRTHRAFSGARLNVLPDLLVVWTSRCPVSAVQSARLGEIRLPSPERRTGAHRPWGFVAAAGPHIPAGAETETIDLLDFAPTILSLTGVAPPEYLRGRPVLGQGRR
jgi:predicted AlkP superfamily phosphohydrolase/phosphomutase